MYTRKRSLLASVTLVAQQAWRHPCENDICNMAYAAGGVTNVKQNHIYRALSFGSHDTLPGLALGGNK